MSDAHSRGADAAELPDPIEPTALADALPDVESAVVLLDFDGTLSPLVDDPAAAAPAPGAVEAVRGLAARTRVLVVSGRPVEDVRGRLPGELPVTFAGGHGAEVADGTDAVEPRVDMAAAERHRDAAIADLESLLADADGWTIEPKPTGVAVHHRRATAPERHLDDVTSVLQRHATGEMEVTHGHDVLELRPAGVHKGVAVADLLADEDRVPVAFGDDVTDEDTFAAVAARGGVSVLVATDPRPSRARWCVADPDAVVATLAAWAAG